jgi:hypothetical protein
MRGDQLVRAEVARGLEADPRLRHAGGSEVDERPGGGQQMMDGDRRRDRATA